MSMAEEPDAQGITLPSLTIKTIVVHTVTYFVAGILAFVLPIIAAVKAGGGQWFTYPLTIPFVR